MRLTAGVHRPALWKSMDDNVLELDVLKQRYGKWPLAVEFDWDPEFGSLDKGRSIAYEKPGTEVSDSDITAASNSFVSKNSLPPRSGTSHTRPSRAP